MRAILLLLICAAALPYGMLGAALEGWLFRPTPRAMVAVADWINENVPPGAPVAVDPEDHPHDFDFWLRRPLVEAEHRRNAFMLGAPPEEFENVRRSLHEAYVSLDGAEATKRFASLGAEVVVARVGNQDALRWRELPCFRVGYRNVEFVVLVQSGEICDPRAR